MSTARIPQDFGNGANRSGSPGLTPPPGVIFLLPELLHTLTVPPIAYWIDLALAPAQGSGLSYAFNPAYAANGFAIQTNSPTLGGGGSANSWSISPALPTGLSFNTTTGVITGTPSATHAQTNYTITALNAPGVPTVVLSLEVGTALLGDSGTPLLSQDGQPLLT